MLVVLLLIFGGQPVYASEPDREAFLQEQTEESGAADLFDALPEETKKLLEELGLSELTEASVYNLSLPSVLQLLLRLFAQAAGTSGKTALAVIGVLLLGALLENIRSFSGPGEYHRIFHATEVLLCALLLLNPLVHTIDAVAGAIRGMTAFQMSFVPVFAGILVTGGQAVTAGNYTALATTVAQGNSFVLSAILLPLLRTGMALCVTGSAAPTIRLQPILNMARKSIHWLLGLMMAVFTAVLSLQSVVGSSADALTDKTAQFVIGSAVPVVGSALSQAYTSVRGYIRLLKSTVGAFGILAAGVMLLPLIVTVIVWQFMLHGCAMIGDLFEQKEQAVLLREFASLMGILMSVLLCGGAMTIVSIGAMLAARGN